MRKRAGVGFLGVLAATVALAVTFGWTGPIRASAATVPTAEIVAPTVGGAPWTDADVAKLHVDLDAILNGPAEIRGAHVGVFVRDTATGTVLYERNAGEEFQPASTLKLVVGSAAIDLLGPAFAPKSTADVTIADALADGVLGFQGNADPFFGERDIDDLVSAVKKSGWKRLGDVVVENEVFAENERPDGWTFDDFGQDYAPPITYATLDENVVHVRVSPAERTGSPVVVSPNPVVSGLATDERSCSVDGAFLLNRAVTQTSTDTLDVAPLPNGCLSLVGRLPSSSAGETLDVALPDPPLTVAKLIVAKLRSAGIAVTGEGSVERQRGRMRTIANVHGRVPIWARDGLPLASVMPRFWVPSDNFVGETLLLHLCPGDVPDARPCALERERSWLQSIGVDPATTTLADGSGLSQYDRITPNDLVAILQHDWNGPNRQLVLDSLPIGGARGTIEGIAGTPAAGRVFAKTGSMMHVRGLAGYLATERHGAVTFAFEVDDWIGDYPALAATRAAVLSRIIQD